LNRRQIESIGCPILRRAIRHHIEIDKVFHKEILPTYQGRVQDIWEAHHRFFPRRRYFFFHLLAEVLLDELLLDVAYWEVFRKISRIDQAVLSRTRQSLLSAGVSFRNVRSLLLFMRNKWILRLSLHRVIFIIKRREKMWGVLPEGWQQTIAIARNNLKKEIKVFYEWLHDRGFGLWQQLV